MGFPHLFAFIGGGLAIAMGLLKQDKLDKKAWKAYCVEKNITAGCLGYDQLKEAWFDGLRHDRQDRTALRRELRQAQAWLSQADEVVRVSVGLFKAQKLLGETDVPAMVRVTIMAHWFEEWNALFNARSDEKRKSLMLEWLGLRLEEFEAEHGKNGRPVAGYGAPTPEAEAKFNELAEKHGVSDGKGDDDA